MSPKHDASKILQALNPPQREAVLHDKGPLFVLAGAGSGKTRVITHRIAYLIHRGYPPDGILAITFTNKAADEMKSRTESLCGVRSPWVSTFHSFCARILRRHIHRLEPYDNSFSIYDSDDSRSVVKEVLKELNVDAGLWTPQAAHAEISRIKNSGKAGSDEAFGSGYTRGQVLREIYLRYTQRLRERNAADFDDLLLLTVRLLEEQVDVLAQYQDQFQQVLIDEYQDINTIQYQIGRILTLRHRNICITGDPDQSIYGWRGADISNILNFQHDYPDARTVTLDKNYRSTGNILAVANSLIAHNEQRVPKDLWTDGPPGEPVRVYRFTDDREEAQEVAALVEQFRREGVPPGDVAVFYRINALSRPVEQEFIYANIPYSIVGGIEFFLRKEVKDVLGYLRSIDNPRDTESAKRILNVPPRGLGKGAMEKLEELARSSGRGLLDLVLGSKEGLALSKKASASLSAFAALMRRLAERKKGPVAELVREVIEETKYEDYLRDTQGEAARERIANVWELVSAASEYDDGHPDGSLTGFLEMVNLLGDVDRWERKEDRVALMSLHSAKGLEFPVVIIVGVEDGIMPLLHSEDPDPDIEEERRLLYVGVTRSRKQLYLTHAANRMRFGRVRQSVPSRFLWELQKGGPTKQAQPDQEAGGDAAGQQPRGGRQEGPEPAPGPIEVDEETASCLADQGSAREPEGEGEDSVTFEDRAEVGWPSEGEYDDSGGDAYPVGATVYHEEYGVGKVTRISGIGRRRRITVAFDECGDKQFVPGFTPLRRLR